MLQQLPARCEPETFDSATPRDSPHSPVPSTPYSPSISSRSPPRQLPGDAGDTAPSHVPGAWGMEAEGANTVSAISEKLLTKFVEGDGESFGHIISDVVEFLDT